MYPLAYRTVLSKLTTSLSKTIAAQVLDVSRWTVWRWTTKRNSQYKRQTKLTQEEEIQVCDYLIKKPHLIQQDIIDYIFQKFNVKVSQSFVSRLLKRSHVTRKRASKAFCEAEEAKKLQFIEKAQNVKSKLMAVDECSFVLNHCTAYGYAKKGDRAVISRPGRRGTRFSFILSISKKAVLQHDLIAGSFKSASFQKHVSSLPNHTLILDNASIHKGNYFVGKKMMYLPPYSPQLNPVEMCFNVIRSHVNRVRPRTLCVLKAAIDTGLSSLSEVTLTKMFQKTLCV